jgi:hypothetical protein
MSPDDDAQQTAKVPAANKTGAFSPKTLLWDESRFGRKSALWRPYEPKDLEKVTRAYLQSFVVRRALLEMKGRKWSGEELAKTVKQEFGISYSGERVRQVSRGDREGRISEYLLWANILGPGILPNWDEPSTAFLPANRVAETDPSNRAR